MNDENLMTKSERNQKPEIRIRHLQNSHSSFVIGISFVIRHSSFVF
jgi:hypothetical protein